MTDYKRKAKKYKQKYIQLKRQIQRQRGGNEEWRDWNGWDEIPADKIQDIKTLINKFGKNNGYELPLDLMSAIETLYYKADEAENEMIAHLLSLRLGFLENAKMKADAPA